LLAQVSEHVYDTATGRFILIPRLQAGWNLRQRDHGGTGAGSRRLDPDHLSDASSIDLGKMPGADEGGYAGFTTRSTTNFWKVFKRRDDVAVHRPACSCPKARAMALLD